MIKKTFIIFAFVLIIYGIKGVQALTIGEDIEPKKESLVNLIEVRTNDVWENLNIYKCNKEDMIIYKIGNDSKQEDKITIGYKENDERLMRVIKNGYKEKSPSKIGVDNEEDAYIATKIAIDCIYKNYSLEYIEKNYRELSDLDEALKIRASKIITAAKKLVDIGYNGEAEYYYSISSDRVGEFEKDPINERYYSQVHELQVQGAKLYSYEVINKSESDIDYFIANPDTGEKQEKFTSNSGKLKIMIPERNKEDAFEIQVDLRVDYGVDAILEATDGKNDYIVYSEIRESCDVAISQHNKESSLKLNLIDEDTLEELYDGIVRINGIDYKISADNEVIIWGMGKGDIEAEIIDVPDGYIIPSYKYKINVGYKENHIADLKLRHKKGRLLIQTNVRDAAYEIYDSDKKQVGIYVTDNEGKVYIDKINTGSYLLKQIGVLEGYLLAEDVVFDIYEDEITRINVINKEGESKKEEEDSKGETEEKTPIRRIC